MQEFDTINRRVIYADPASLNLAIAAGEPGQFTTPG